MFGRVNNDHLIGAAVGVGASALAYYIYKKNECQVDNFLMRQGISVPASNKDYNNMSIEELMETKELIEDVIAEREVSMCKDVSVTE